MVAVRAYSSAQLADLHEDAMTVYRALGNKTPQILPIIVGD
jgi:hypothetical protein